MDDFIKYKGNINYSPSIKNLNWNKNQLTFLSKCIAQPTLWSNGEGENLATEGNSDVSFIERIKLSSETIELVLKPDDSIYTEVVKLEETPLKINIEKEENTANAIEVVAYPNPFQSQISVKVVNSILLF